MDTETDLPKRDRTERSRFGVRTYRYALLAVACAAVLFLVNTFVVQPFVIPSGSMENTLRIGDRVVVNKLAYRFGGSPRGGGTGVVLGGGAACAGGGGAPFNR